MLLEAVPARRIVTAMVVWSEIGILGYLLGPVAGGVVTQVFGLFFLALVPACAMFMVLGIVAGARRATA